MSIVLNDLYKAYGKQIVVDHVSLEIETGELFVLLGASGSGKSTLLRLIAGLIPLDTGRVSLDGRDVTEMSPQGRNTGFVFQNYSLFRHMTVAQNIEFGLEIRNLPRADRQKQVSQLLTLIDLEGLGERMPAQLSGGQQQRVALARALAYQPSVLLLDEPFGALDVKIRAQLRRNLRDIQRELNVTAILVTHDQEEAFELADRIGIIEQGKLLEVGTPDALYRRPTTRFAATFLGTANLLQGTRNGTHVHVGDDISVTAPPATEHLSGKPVDLLIRPEEIELALQRESLRAEALGSAVVRRVEFAGHMEKVTVQLNGQSGEELQVLLTPSEARALKIRPQNEVWVGLRDYHLIPR